MATADTKDSSFKLPASSLEEVFKVIQGYASVKKSASLSDIAKNTGMHTTAISKNVGFLLSIGLLEGGKNKAPTEVGSKLGFALMHNMAEEVEAILADIVADNEFLKNVLAAVRIRKGMDASALRSHIAYSAGLSKTGSTTTGTGAVIELLKRSGHLAEEDGKLVVSSPVTRVASEATVPEKIPTATSVRSMEARIDTDSPLSISIRIEVRCEAKDLDTLGPKLRKVVDDFSSREMNEARED